MLSLLVLLLGALVAVVLVIVSSLCTIVAAYSCVSSCFRAADVHQMLPALLSPLLVWSLFVFQVFDGPDVAAPWEVLYAFLLGGPLTVTALSVWEVRRLRSRYGMTLRRLHPQLPPEGPPLVGQPAPRAQYAHRNEAERMINKFKAHRAVGDAPRQTGLHLPRHRHRRRDPLWLRPRTRPGSSLDT
ncbi:hypothetical protein [Streptomyces qinglanensis]|uniref:hypothetical protein n=1 Tax=Streptomyces qinglanensis TaxID=943816 RepID=UPI003D74EAAE